MVTRVLVALLPGASSLLIQKTLTYEWLRVNLEVVDGDGVKADQWADRDRSRDIS